MKSGVLGKAGRLACAIVVSLGVVLTMGRSDTWAAVRQTLGEAYEYDRGSPAALPQAATTVYLPFVARYYDGRIPPFGVQFFPRPTGRRLTYAAEAGVRWIRKPISWSVVERTNTTPDNYNWSSTDSWVIEATQEGVHLILTLQGQPSWAAIYPQGPVTNTQDLLEFVGALVERYDGDGVDDASGSPVVQHFELYNEQDNYTEVLAERGGWGIWGHNGAGYAELLQALHPVVHAANPHAKLVFGGIALDYFEPEGPHDPEFLDDVLRACEGQDCFDVMNFHYYPPFRGVWEQYGAGIIGKASYVRQKLAEYGFADDTPLICTEMGWSSYPPPSGDELQSRYACKGYVRAMAADLGVAIWYQIEDWPDDLWLMGLLDSDLQPKPSHTAYRTAAELLAGARYQQVLTFAVASTATVAVYGQPLIYDYVFERHGRRLDVVWTEDEIWPPYDPYDDPVSPLTVSVARLRVLDKFGNETWVNDEDDGTADGQIIIAVSGSPLYLEYYP